MFKDGKPEKDASKLYDSHITATIPYYDTFNIEVINFVRANWQRLQMERGKFAGDAASHIKRFGVEYFPVTVEEHLSLLRETGFKIVELLCFSYLQAGFYAIK